MLAQVGAAEFAEYFRDLLPINPVALAFACHQDLGAFDFSEVRTLDVLPLARHEDPRVRDGAKRALLHILHSHENLHVDRDVPASSVKRGYP